MKQRVFSLFACLVAMFAVIAAIVPSSAKSTSQTMRVVVDARANVFGLGTGGLAANGGGVAPAVMRVPAGWRWLTLAAAGKVSCCSGEAGSWNGADGGTYFKGEDLQSTGGISGVKHPKRSMFLVGVFLGPSAPAGAGPARLDFAATESALTVRPLLAQTFYVGSGRRAGRSRAYYVPAGATRLVLGFADGSSFNGVPGWYDDNKGTVNAIVTGH